MEHKKIVNMLSIDVEDYFHVSAFERVSPPDSWSAFECRVEKNTEIILDILSRAEVRATFFVLGWVANKSPKLVKKIAEHGHEIASHGYGHQRVSQQTRQEFREDIRQSKSLLEDLTGHPVNGYRAPSYSICHKSLWAFDELVEAGYRYDSSVFPVQHDFYGISNWPRFMFPLRKIADGNWTPGNEMSHIDDFVEIPISTLNKAGRNLPIAGGGYFRLYPYALTKMGLNQINKQENQPFVFYLHPWEFDADQPRMKHAGMKSNLRHYLNLKKTRSRFTRLVQDFKFSAIEDVLKARAENLLSDKYISGLAMADESI